MTHHHESHENYPGVSVSGYLIGFILSVVLTLMSFYPVMTDMLHDWTVSGKIIYLIGIGIIQILVQSFYFLHLHHGDNARWNVWIYAFALTCAVIIIGGSWWAIQHLNYNMMGGSGRIVTPEVIKIEPAAVSEQKKPESKVEKLSSSLATSTPVAVENVKVASPVAVSSDKVPAAVAKVEKSADKSTKPGSIIVNGVEIQRAK